MSDYMNTIKLSEDAYESLDKLCDAAYTAIPGDGGEASAENPTALPSLLEFRRRMLSLHAKRHLVTELAATGKLTESEAQAMVDAGESTSYRPGASGAAFANILVWLQANGPAIEQEIAAAIPVIISLIALFGG